MLNSLQCSVSCGGGFQYRGVDCRDSTNQLTTSCSEETKPDARQRCSTNIECNLLDESEEDVSSDIYETEPEPLATYPDPPSPERLIGEQIVPSEST